MAVDIAQKNETFQKFEFSAFDTQHSVNSKQQAEDDKVLSELRNISSIDEIAEIELVEKLLQQKYKLGHEEGHKQGLEEGKAAGAEETRTQMQQEIAATTKANEEHVGSLFEALSSQFNDIYEQYIASKEQAFSDTVILALKIARKIADNALAENPMAEIETMVEKCIPVLLSHPDFSVYVNPDMVALVSNKIDELRKKYHFNGNIHVKDDNGLQVSDCRITWKEGGVERNVENMWKEIETYLQPRNQIPPKETVPLTNIGEEEIETLNESSANDDLESLDQEPQGSGTST